MSVIHFSRSVDRSIDWSENIVVEIPVPTTQEKFEFVLGDSCVPSDRFIVKQLRKRCPYDPKPQLKDLTIEVDVVEAVGEFGAHASGLKVDLTSQNHRSSCHTAALSGD
jgi:hypothetical protein